MVATFLQLYSFISATFAGLIFWSGTMRRKKLGNLLRFDKIGDEDP